MNKSLVLVMCDVLVLSALSLSTGGISGDQGQPIAADESAKVDVGVADELRRELENVKFDLNRIRQDADAATKARDDAEAKRKAAEDDAGRARQDADAANKARDDAEAKRKAAEDDAGKARRDADAATKARDDAEAKRKAAEADAGRARQDADAANKARDDAEAKRKAAEDDAGKARRDADAATKARDDAEAKRKAAEADAGKARRDADAANKARDDADAKRKVAEDVAGKARQDADAANKARDDAEAKRKAAESAKRQSDAAAFAAMKERDEIDEKYGVPERAHQERVSRIRGSACRVIVEFKKSKKDVYYSPTVSIGEGFYVFAFYDGKVVSSLSRVCIEDRNGLIHEVSDAYYLKGSPDIVAFKLRDVSAFGALSVGDESGESEQYWIRHSDGRTVVAPVLSPGLRTAIKDYEAISMGDVLVDAKTASVICFATSKGTLADWLNAKGSYRPCKIITDEDLHHWKSF